LPRQLSPPSSPPSRSSSLLQVCSAEPEKGNKQTKEQKDRAIEQKEKLVKGEYC
jgi:hypothetical protein